MKSRVTERREKDHGVANTGDWQEQLRKEICKLVRRNSPAANHKRYEWFCKPEPFCEERRNKCGTKSAGEVSPSQCEKLSLGQLCEIYIWLSKTDSPEGNGGLKSLVREVLKVQDLANILPCHAHYYIAYLAREGLIDEVITTNYDTCLEEAYNSTWLQSNKESKSALVIVDHEDYRKGASKHKVPFLKVYKINGCANKLRTWNKKTDSELKDRATEPEETILLTERQLQDWRQRHWARDLFRDRLRSRTIVFSGFGSDEPQVRHTVLQVIEEFQLSSSRKNHDFWWKLPNSPFIAAYEGYLSFSQLQILVGFIQAHSGADQVLEEAYDNNAFTAEDLPLFRDSEDQKELPADLFWKRVYQGTFKKLLRKYCQPNSAAVAFLMGIIPKPVIMFAQFLDAVAPETAPFGTFPGLLTIDNSYKTTPLSRVIWKLNNKGEPPEGWYASLMDYPVAIPLVLLLTFLASGRKNGPVDLEKHIRLETGFPGLTFSNGRYAVEAFLANSEQVELPENMRYTPEGKNIVLITLEGEPDERVLVTRVKQIQRLCSESTNVKISLLHKIPVRLLLRKAYEKAYAIDRLHEEICNLLMTPTVLVDDLRPRLDKRRRVKRLN